MAKSTKSDKATNQSEPSAEEQKELEKPVADTEADVALSEPDPAPTIDEAAATEPIETSTASDTMSAETADAPPESDDVTDSAAEDGPAPETSSEDSADDEPTDDAVVVDDTADAKELADPEDGSDPEDAASPEVSQEEADRDEPDATAHPDPWHSGDEDDAEKPAALEQETMPVAPQPEPQKVIVRGSIWPGFFGGVIAALVGFFVGRGDVVDPYLPEALQRPKVDTTAIEAKADEIAALTADQELRLEVLETAEPAVVAEAVTDPALAATVETVAERVDALETQMSAPVQVDTTATDAAIAALQSALDAQNAQIESLTAEVEAAQDSAAGEAALILARAALARVMLAVDSGESFSPALSDLEEVAPIDVPSPLQEAAESGVPTLAALQDDYPAAARAALTASRSEIGANDVNISNFIKRTLNARSVTPKDGDDADAILSRAEAAIRTGDLDTALAELNGLSEETKSAMNDWLEAASARKAAQDAAKELADSLHSN